MESRWALQACSQAPHANLQLQASWHGEGSDAPPPLVVGWKSGQHVRPIWKAQGEGKRKEDAAPGAVNVYRDDGRGLRSGPDQSRAASLRGRLRALARTRGAAMFGKKRSIWAEFRGLGPP